MTQIKVLIDTNLAVCFSMVFQSNSDMKANINRQCNTCTAPAKHVVGATPLHAHYATAIYVD